MKTDKLETKQYLIHSPDHGWLDGYDGGTLFEWTKDKKVAWRLSYQKATHYLSMIRSRNIAVNIVDA